MTDRFYVIVVRDVSHHKTAKAASAALKKIKTADGDLAMVVEIPEKKEKRK